ncbi:recombinase family protein [Clostridium sp. OS1-26]|uniref:recombinase family protein n=1 Tax=Clostridium sp. OS1-26 TaxID=3070681 RepID=UPI0027E0A2A5|nr:recombinase family protein [Clostridium sp. OS1-26]WML36956.1 recombinase family protein [Clostridium sp. OS1-26]
MIAIYARQSVDKKDSISIETQIDECMLEARILKKKVEVYKDKGFSGKNLDRDDFKRMMKDIKAGKISTVIVYKMDRISRSVVDFVNTYDVFKAKDVKFISCTEKFDTTTDAGEAMLKIVMVFAELERKTIQQRVVDAYTNRSRKGFYMGGRVPYGFKRVPFTIDGKKSSQYAPEPEEVRQLKILFDLYSRPGTSIGEVVKYLRENNIKKARGIEWSTPRITEILRNPIYVRADADVYAFYSSRGTEIVDPPERFIGTNGCYLYTKPKPKLKPNDSKDSKDVENIKETKDTKSSKNMAHYKDMLLVLAPHEGIIDSGTWIKCRLKAEQNIQIPRSKRVEATWLSGKLKCAKCGYALRYNKWQGKTTFNEYFLCSEVCGNRRCTGFGVVKKDFLEGVILEQLKAKVLSLKVEQDQPNPNTSEINRIKAEIATKNKEIDEIVDTFVAASSTIKERLNKTVDKLNDEIEKLNDKIVRLESSSISRDSLDPEQIEEIFDEWDEVSREDKQTVVDILIQKVLVCKESVEIVWRV